MNGKSEVDEESFAKGVELILPKRFDKEALANCFFDLNNGQNLSIDHFKKMFNIHILNDSFFDAINPKSII